MFGGYTREQRQQGLVSIGVNPQTVLGRVAVRET